MVNNKANKTSFKKGHKGWNKGLTKETDSRVKLPKSAREGVRKSLLGKTGKNSRNWQCGKTNLRRLIPQLDKYKQWRSDVFKRDNWTCQTCNKRGCYLEAHHIKSLKEIFSDNKIKNSEDALKCKELWELNNGVTLCKDCHKLTDSFAGKNLKNG